ncbi:MAG: thiol:disulfide interchange protein DsbA/DsbL [Zoogloeaceae bacterium]|nr:thiol:disulfide interchange protein DsbA/DsbL [Rhodocyclaceae bacterium]MCP5233068.1 thiol:disulfide interchange protein DsbA/DsbL [Zoogloeaceae bacterium]MCP5240374.1 thiol:disulfide interchange protein DsbA/DsbL [Zoogloeaceae bacterium]MCP5253515.1 thiol:disulfide interchange protein DsbA/DsbL [Zoogloeaceae bacterium]MCP5294948.1 thiol:disulfide interchange protein DsbA/DsbL [Zoogloeaceae bacterium]
MDRRSMLKQMAAVVGVAAMAGKVSAQQPFAEVNPPQPTGDAGKIEVLEFFHYGCPHCRDFDPLLEKWVAALPKDVEFKRVPAIWGNAQLKELARFYYTLEVTGELHALHSKVFTALQSDKVPLNTEDGVRAWIAKQGGDEKRFMETYKSFGVQSMVQRADQIARAYKIQGVPTLAIDGKYLTAGSMAGTHENALKVADQLIQRVRAARPKS